MNHKPVNAMSSEFMHSLATRVQEVENDNCRGIILASVSYPPVQNAFASTILHKYVHKACQL